MAPETSSRRRRCRSTRLEWMPKSSLSDRWSAEEVPEEPTEDTGAGTLRARSSGRVPERPRGAPVVELSQTPFCSRRVVPALLSTRAAGRRRRPCGGCRGDGDARAPTTRRRRGNLVVCHAGLSVRTSRNRRSGSAASARRGHVAERQKPSTAASARAASNTSGVQAATDRKPRLAPHSLGRRSTSLVEESSRPPARAASHTSRRSAAVIHGLAVSGERDAIVTARIPWTPSSATLLPITTFSEPRRSDPVRSLRRALASQAVVRRDYGPCPFPCAECP